jgi:hypothetical protein
MDVFDEYCVTLLDDAKRFLEIAKDKYKQENNNNHVDPFLRASILIAFSSLEAFVFGITDDFKESEALTIFEKGFLDEKLVDLKNGEFIISKKLKMTRLIERIEFLLVKFKSKKFNKADDWWGHLNDGINKRNSIVHPRDREVLTIENVGQTLTAIITCIDMLFKAVYKRDFPANRLQLISKAEF